MSQAQTTVLQGTLDLLILKALGPGELHGPGISRRIEQITKGTFHVKPGPPVSSPASYGRSRLTQRVLGEPENNRRAKFYRLTTMGIKQIEAEIEQWGRVALAMTNVLKAN